MFSENALKVLEKRYFLRDENGQSAEDVDALFLRVAKAVAASESRFGASAQEIDELTAVFQKLMLDRDFMPNSPTLMNAGKPGGQLSACFVLPVPDNLEGIFETCKNAALIHKTGGGTGFSFSRIRPANDRVATSSGVASGPISFMTVYDAATEAIRQGGTRRGANMGILRIDHPDIEDFITCKKDTTRLNNFNISVAVTNTFMEAVKTDSQFALTHPVSGKVVRTVRARDLFDRIVQNAHETGEPGIVFIDRINDEDPIRQTIGDDGRPIAGTEDIEATNPCGEQPLGPGDACNLGSINVANYVLADRSGFDYARLAKTVALCVRFLDDVIDANNYPFDFVRQATLNNRRIGLGLMGFAEALIRMGIAYNSTEAVDKASELMSFINSEGSRASCALAESRGAFPNFPYSRWATESGEKSKNNQKRRNATVTTIAPTGTISIIAGTTSGIEPLFAISFVRRVMGGTELIEVNPLFEMQARERGFYSEELMRKIAEIGTVHDLQEVPQDIRDLWVCAHDISAIWHVRMQAAFQAHTDNAVSKTINFPAHATVEQVYESFMSAWDLGLKGITVYRDTSRRTQVLNIRQSDPLKKTVSAGQKGTVTSPRTKGAEVSEAVLKSKSGALMAVSISPAYPSVYSPAHAGGELCPQCGALSESFLKYEACCLCAGCGYTKC